MSSNEGPKRHDSTPTMPRPREALPPPAPSEPVVDPREVITLVECPRCRDCGLCDGAGMITPAKAAEWARIQREIAELDEP